MFSLFLPLKFTFLGDFSIVSLISASIDIHLFLYLFENNWENMFHQYFILHQRNTKNLRSSMSISKLSSSFYFFKCPFVIATRDNKTLALHSQLCHSSTIISTLYNDSGLKATAKPGV